MRLLRFLPSRGLSTGIVCRNRATEELKPDMPKRTTVDVTEVENHSRLSTSWWDSQCDLKALHAMNPLRVQFVRDGLANTGIALGTPSLPLQGIKILDVGCGGGFLSEPLVRIGAHVTGIDASEDLITTAVAHAKLDHSLSSRLNYVCTTIEEFSTANSESYDALVASEVVEHVHNKELFLKSCASIVKPGGSIFVTTLNKTFPAWLGGIVAAEQILKIVPSGTHDWNKFVSPEDIQRLLEKYDCKTKLIHGMFYNPLTNEWFWTSTTVINYALHAVKRKHQE